MFCALAEAEETETMKQNKVDTAVTEQASGGAFLC